MEQPSPILSTGLKRPREVDDTYSIQQRFAAMMPTIGSYDFIGQQQSTSQLHHPLAQQHDANSNESSTTHEQQPQQHLQEHHRHLNTNLPPSRRFQRRLAKVGNMMLDNDIHLNLSSSNDDQSMFYGNQIGNNGLGKEYSMNFGCGDDDVQSPKVRRLSLFHEDL